jgi:hypothetical protein
MWRRTVSRQVTTLNWTWLTTLGLAGGLIGGLLVGMPLGKFVNAMVTTAAVTCFVGGVLGSFQAFGLRPVLQRPLWWVLGTVAGLGIGLAAGAVIVEQLGTLFTGARQNIARLGPFARAISLVTVGLVAGTALGVGQWLVLRSQAPRISHWVWTTAIGLAISLCAGSLLLTAVGLRISSGLGVSAFVMISGLTFGAITSRPLRRAA